MPSLSPLTEWLRFTIRDEGTYDLDRWASILETGQESIHQWFTGNLYPSPAHLRTVLLVANLPTFQEALVAWNKIKNLPLSESAWGIGSDLPTLAHYVLPPVVEELLASLTSCNAETQERILKNAHSHAVREVLRAGNSEPLFGTYPSTLLELQGFEKSEGIATLRFDKYTGEDGIFEHTDYFWTIVVSALDRQGEFAVRKLQPYRAFSRKGKHTYGWSDYDGNVINNEFRGAMPHDRERVTHFYRSKSL